MAEEQHQRVYSNRYILKIRVWKSENLAKTFSSVTTYIGMGHYG